MDQVVAAFRYVFHAVPGIPQGMEQPDHRGRRVQPYRVADASVLGRVIAEDDGDPLFSIGCAAQVGPLDSQAGHQVHPVFPGHVPL